ncbi:hypothetical protein B481_3073 [Planococcus halocryophilus Or1]|nr:hypothetical protein B481_3073 [Planococcus halocryophilus Or1]
MNYAEAINETFKERGIHKEVSALSFEAQGLDQIAEVRLERNEYQYVKRMEEKGLEAQTFYHQLNQDIRQKMLKLPSYAIKLFLFLPNKNRSMFKTFCIAIRAKSQQN